MKPNQMRLILRIVIAIAFISCVSGSQAQRARATNLVYMDKQGVLRYTNGNAEANFYGVNYTTPFAHAYRAHKALKIDLEQAIRDDVYHFARLGFDAFRVHVWDTEISDTAGNLLENDHLRLYDYLLAELKKRNIKTIITPIAFWGNGYPERDEPTPGFSRYFGRGKLTTNDTAIRAQENFMRQFFKHVNPYTKMSYEDDKDIIAVEINNEPSHSNPKKGVTDYINRLVAAVKSTGWTKPIFYNIAQGPYFSDAVAASNVDGFSFQWYPSGLVGNQTIKGNVLPHIDVYRIPFRDTVPAFKNKALMVYEFDAADVFDSYVYPAMARSFRGAGMQWATQFAYDPMAIANVNTEYQTHYLNLAYTPSKAISMLIASEVFHRVPRLKSYGTYPADTSFDVFRVSYTHSLSEMNSGDRFYYSSTSSTIPSNQKLLKNIAGVGHSSIVFYWGTGAYFLDKIEQGVWRLEVMPDVVYIRDPFERASPHKIVSAIDWNDNTMEILLDELGQNFHVKGINKGNSYSANAKGTSFQVRPGTYLVTKAGITYSGSKKTIGVIELNEFVAPSANNVEIVLRHEPFSEVSAGRSFIISVIIGGIDTGRVSVQLSRLGGGLFRTLQMKNNGYGYAVEVPADVVTGGQLQYRIIVQEGETYVTYPGGFKGNPFAWDNYRFETYKTNIAAAGSSLELYNPSNDRTVYVAPNFRRGFQSSYVSGSNTGSLVQRFSITEMQNNEVMGLQHYIGTKLNQRRAELNSFDKIILRAKADNGQSIILKIALVSKHGVAFSMNQIVSDRLQDIELPLSNLKADSTLLLPRPYPGFQPLYFKSSIANPVFNLNDIEKIEITVSPNLQASTNRNLAFEIESVRLSQGK